MPNPMVAAAKALLPAAGYRSLTRLYWRSKPSPLDRYRRLTPVSPLFGRGLPIDRFYIESFLDGHRADVRGRVLEVGVRSYTERYGGDRVERSDVLHVAPEADGVDGRATTVVGDLASGAGIPSDSFDCIILTQTLQMIYDVSAAVGHVHRALAPAGVVLATFSGISQVSRYDMDRWGEYWRFTDRAVRRLFETRFAPADVQVDTFGNVLAATAFLHGLGADELSRRERAYHDPDFPVTVAVRAVRAASGGTGSIG